MNNKIKNLLKNKYFKIVVFVLFCIFMINELHNTYIDIYNFRQLEKAKVMLEKIPKDAKKFYSLKEFSEIYKVNILPLKECYYVSNSN